ncbi:hypothetical protein F444_21781 [Phytophthora nicotianae P1976]|uniref:Uncharacterized protein n=1 Tax=Phytophthora nicotianae P1976 TaxID=1317066 RepID=A0A080YZY2_PHYNI|nr:hypothetical protein F444_21781 [Phytophthora nicotianae P1976]
MVSCRRRVSHFIGGMGILVTRLPGIVLTLIVVLMLRLMSRIAGCCDPGRTLNVTAMMTVVILIDIDILLLPVCSQRRGMYWARRSTIETSGRGTDVARRRPMVGAMPG